MRTCRWGRSGSSASWMRQGRAQLIYCGSSKPSAASVTICRNCASESKPIGRRSTQSVRAKTWPAGKLPSLISSLGVHPMGQEFLPGAEIRVHGSKGLLLLAY